MQKPGWLIETIRFSLLLGLLLVSSPIAMAGATLAGMETVSDDEWDPQAVRRVLNAFAYGAQSTDAQIRTWSRMPPHAAIEQILTFRPLNLRLSPHGYDDPGWRHCGSLQELQEFWTSDDHRNLMRLESRPFFATLERDEDAVSPLHLILAWSRAVHTPGCNPFLHKIALYITNYHAAIRIQNASPTLMRSYYDDVLAELEDSGNFVELMTLAASHAALALAYGHMDNVFDREGDFQGNDDFAREYFQLLFGIQGTTEDEVYHENVTIEHNAWLLTGMALDAEPYAWGSERRLDWLVAPIRFFNHLDAAGRPIPNWSNHYAAYSGPNSCLEILHNDICGRNAEEKLIALGPVAAAHPESMANTPLKFIRFFGDDMILPEEAVALQAAWADAEYDLLAFLRAYAISTLFHSPDTVKARSAFDRNLLIHNLNQISAEEAWVELPFQGPAGRMYDQGALVFAPVRDVFGGQTGQDAASDRFVFKSAWDANILDPTFLIHSRESYRNSVDGEVHEWHKNWGAMIPAGDDGLHQAGEVADWLWERFVNDGQRYFDPLARAQVLSLLVAASDLGALLDPENPVMEFDPERLQSGDMAAWVNQLAAVEMDFSQLPDNQKVGLAISFITALPYTFSTGGVQ